MCTCAGLAAIIATEDQGMTLVQLELDSTVLVNTLKSNEYDHSPEPRGVLFREKFHLSTQFAQLDLY
jgi:hypothetical protein